MINFVILGIWACAVSLGAAFGVMSWQKAKAELGTDTVAPASTIMRTKTISVPMMIAGEVDGYVVARFEVVIETGKPTSTAATTESLVADEAFKLIYSRSDASFRVAQKHDLQALTKTIADGVNARFGGVLVKDVLVESWSYLTKEDVDKLNEQ